MCYWILVVIIRVSLYIRLYPFLTHVAFTRLFLSVIIRPHNYKLVECVVVDCLLNKSACKIQITINFYVYRRDPTAIIDTLHLCHIQLDLLNQALYWSTVVSLFSFINEIQMKKSAQELSRFRMINWFQILNRLISSF